MEGRTVGHSFKRRHTRTIPAKFGLIWLCDVKVYDVRWTDRPMTDVNGWWTPMIAKAHMIFGQVS